MSSLSVIIITKNESKNIVACLDSIKFADEIIVLDSGSTDNTVELCSKYTPNVYRVDWPGFGVQKNRALAKCNSEWVFSIDADEIVSPPLRDEILTIINNSTSKEAYSVVRKSTYCNRPIHHGDWRNDSCVRLFKRHSARFKEVPVHEELIVEGRVGKLAAPLFHNTFSSLEDVLQKLNDYSTLSAAHKYQHGRKSTLFTAITRGLWTFFRGYILRLGFLDGKRGFMLAVSNAEGCYYRYLKIMLLDENIQ